MAKKQNDTQSQERRRSRKEILRERKQQRQTREIRLAVAGVVGLLVLVLVAALVVEYVVRPNQAVATVNETTITLRDWQNRVRYQRAQFIIQLEDQLEAFQDLAMVQQFSQQQMSLLQQPEALGELILEQMIDEELIRQQAALRGIEVTEEEVDARIGEQFNYFGGDLPTPTPTATATIEPTPSLTPIPTDVITETLPTNTPAPTPTTGATPTPRPSPTPVSEASFQEAYGNQLERLGDYGVSEETFRSAVRGQIYREKLADALGEDLPREAEMASVYTIFSESEELAQETLAQIEDEGFLATWNEIRSEPPPAPDEAEEQPQINAGEVLWRTQDQLEQQYGPNVAQAALELPLGEPSEVLTHTASTQDAEGAAVTETRYYVIQVSGREMREQAPSAIENQKQQLVSEMLNELRQGGSAQISIDPIWRSRVPTQPILDPSFLVPPPTQPAVVPTQPPLPTQPVVPEAEE